MRIYPASLYNGRPLGGHALDEHDSGLYVLGRRTSRSRGEPAGGIRTHAGLADGYFILPYTIAIIWRATNPKLDITHPAFATRKRIGGDDTKADGHSRQAGRGRLPQGPGKILWEFCGMTRNASGLKRALVLIPELRRSSGEMSGFPASCGLQPGT